jgi:hypothetical protein
MESNEICLLNTPVCSAESACGQKDRLLIFQEYPDMSGTGVFPRIIAASSYVLNNQ